MIKCFISYGHIDDRKREILERILLINGITPLVVANRNEPAMLLATKVENAIEESDYLIPILTKGSINNQWVNQEIGYANKLVTENKIKIVPLVEESKMDELKGFIHKQMDLSFHFSSNSHMGSENKAFKKQCERLAKYILSKPTPKKISTGFNATFSKIYVRTLNKDGTLQLNSSIILENTGINNYVIKEIEISFPSLLKPTSNGQNENIVFKSVFFIEHSKLVSIKTNHLLLRSNAIKSFEQLIFESAPLSFDTGYTIRNSFIEDLKTVDSVHAKFKLVSGELIEKEVKTFHPECT